MIFGEFTEDSEEMLAEEREMKKRKYWEVNFDLDFDNSFLNGSYSKA